MKLRMIFMVFAMMFFAVQGYAQRQIERRGSQKERSSEIKEDDRPKIGIRRGNVHHGTYSNTPRKLIRFKEEYSFERNREPLMLNHNRKGYDRKFKHGAQHYEYRCNFKKWAWIGFMAYNKRFVYDKQVVRILCLW